MYKVELDTKKTLIKEFKYYDRYVNKTLTGGGLYAYQILLDYKKEYGDLKYTSYYITDPNFDVGIGIFTKTTNYKTYESNYWFSNFIKVGDLAVYDMYNFKYLGEIKSIGQKTVTITAYKGHEYNEKNHRLNFYTFAMYNGDYNPDKWIKENQEVSYTI